MLTGLLIGLVIGAAGGGYVVYRYAAKAKAEAAALMQSAAKKL